MNNASVAKAVIFKVNPQGTRIGPDIPCLFNPKEYTFTKQNNWVPDKSSGKNVQKLEFGSGQPAVLKLELFFDTFASRKDVREAHTDALWELMLVDETMRYGKDNKAWPPLVRFQWGNRISFRAAVTNISQKFTLFLDNGIPVRATVSLTLKEVEDSAGLPAQNPSSGGQGGERVWTVKAGDTLVGIAYEVYGDPNRWRQIADQNKLTEVRRLIPGTKLLIP
jgi:hypothetical protein